MATQRQMRRDSAANLAAVTPADGEHVYDTTNNRLGAGDGVTAGNNKKLFALMQGELVTMAPIFDTAGGTADALTLTLDPVPVSYTAGMALLVKAAAANTAAATINVNGLGAKTIKKNAGADDLEADDIEAGGLYILVYDGTNFQIISGAGGGTAIDVQEFPASGTWTAPGGGTIALVQLTGAGASGAKRTTSSGGGGGGGGYVEGWLLLADLGATESVTIGAGGASRTTSAHGEAGGNSTFGSHATAYGGGGGANAAGAGGGGGGGAISAGGSSTSTTGGTGGGPGGGSGGSSGGSGSAAGSGSGGGGGGSDTTGSGGAAQRGGGGAGGGGNSGAGAAGGNSEDGGGGGGGGGFNTAGGTGGVSKRGGNGGQGQISTNNAVAGTQPGGGGGGSKDGNSGAGADGFCRVTVW